MFVSLKEIGSIPSELNLIYQKIKKMAICCVYSFGGDGADVAYFFHFWDHKWWREAFLFRLFVKLHAGDLAEMAVEGEDKKILLKSDCGNEEVRIW